MFKTFRLRLLQDAINAVRRPLRSRRFVISCCLKVAGAGEAELGPSLCAGA